jgi:hypothetical protein
VFLPDAVVILKYSCWFFLALMLALSTASAALPNADLVAALEKLRLSSGELLREDKIYRTARKKSNLSQIEMEEYAQFIAGLRLRLFKQCEVVRKLNGAEKGKEYGCQNIKIAKGGGSSEVLTDVLNRKALTEEENRQALDAKLSALEADIDEALLKRQRSIKEKATNSGEASGGGGGAGSSVSSGASGKKRASASGGGATSGPGKKYQKAKKNSKKTGPSSAPTKSVGQTSPTGGMRTASKGSPRRQGTDDGNDDDIIARQLREAAEKEMDPVLKKKLWDEYRKYREAGK